MNMHTTISECNEPVASNIKKTIFLKGYKQRKVAEDAGFSVSDFNAMLNGRKIIKQIHIPFIAKALDVEVNDLFTQSS